jgi:hypothetical protein
MNPFIHAAATIHSKLKNIPIPINSKTLIEDVIIGNGTYYLNLSKEASPNDIIKASSVLKSLGFKTHFHDNGPQFAHNHLTISLPSSL